MKRFILILLCFISTSSSFAVLEDQIAIKPDRAYMQFFLKGYLSWFKQKFNFELNQHPLVLESLKDLDHWRTSEMPELDQLLIGQDMKGKFSYRIYVSEALRKNPAAKSFPEAPHFLEWSEGEGLCYLAPVKDFGDFKVPSYEGVEYFGHFCQKDKWALSEISFLGPDEELSFPNPFRGQSRSMWKTYDKTGIKSEQYFAKSTHLGLIPKELLTFVNAHGGEVLLPFDKYSIDRFGRMIIYYP